jgi:hypothetical protein
MSLSNYGILEVNPDSDQCGKDTAEVSMLLCKCHGSFKYFTADSYSHFISFVVDIWLMQLITTKLKLPEMSFTIYWINHN